MYVALRIFDDSRFSKNPKAVSVMCIFAANTMLEAKTLIADDDQFVDYTGERTFKAYCDAHADVAKLKSQYGFNPEDMQVEGIQLIDFSCCIRSQITDERIEQLVEEKENHVIKAYESHEYYPGHQTFLVIVAPVNTETDTRNADMYIRYATDMQTIVRNITLELRVMALETGLYRGAAIVEVFGPNDAINGKNFITREDLFK